MVIGLKQRVFSVVTRNELFKIQSFNANTCQTFGDIANPFLHSHKVKPRRTVNKYAERLPRHFSAESDALLIKEAGGTFNVCQFFGWNFA